MPNNNFNINILVFSLLNNYFLHIFFTKIGLVISKSAIIRKMNELLEENDIDGVKCSNGWLNRFLKRYKLTTRRITGSGRNLSVDFVVVVKDYLQAVNKAIEKNCNIYF